MAHRRFRPATAGMLSLMLLCGAAQAHAQMADRLDNASLIERIMQADTDGDGQVTRAELIAYRAQQFGRLDRNGDGFIAMNDVPGLLSGRFAPRMQQLQAQFDANHDGRVSHDEFVNGPTPGFDMADANHDGVVTQAEMKLALAKAKAARRQ